MKRLHPVLLPLGFGLLAAVASWYVPVRDVPEQGFDPQAPGDGDREPVANATPTGLTWVFPEGPALPGGACAGDPLAFEDFCTPVQPVVAVTFANGPGLPTPGQGTGFEADLDWRPNGHVALAAVRQDHRECVRAPCPQPAAPWIARRLPVEPAFGEGNHSVAGVSFYAFEEGGLMLASNVPDLARPEGLREYPDAFQALPERPWYLGDGAAPDGTWKPAGRLGEYARALRAQLVGLPVGGVATVVLEDHDYASLVGPVVLTLRIESLAQAP